MQEIYQDFSDKLDFYFIDNLSTPGIFDNAMEGIEGVIHVASPLNYNATDKKKELIEPAINGVRTLLDACKRSKVRRVVMTSSFGAVLDMGRNERTPYTYSSRDWNPITYEEATAPDASAQDAYRGSKVFAEKEAWKFITTERPAFDLVTFCPSMVFGPVMGGFKSSQELNESNKLLWKVATGGASGTLPPARFNFWIDVRDLAEIQVEALLQNISSGKRYVPVAPEKFNYQLVSEIIQEISWWPSERITVGTQGIKKHVDVDCQDVRLDFPAIQFRSLKETVLDFMEQMDTALKVVC